MDPIRLLESDHVRIRYLFTLCGTLRSDEHRRRQEVFARLARELRILMAIEADPFYPAVRAQLPEATAHADEERLLIGLLLEEIERTLPNHERYRAKIVVLQEMVEHQFAFEEAQI